MRCGHRARKALAEDVHVGASSRDICLRAEVELLATEEHPLPKISWRYRSAYLGSKGSISRERFAALLDTPLPENRADWPGQHTLNTPISDMRAALIGRLLGQSASARSKN